MRGRLNRPDAELLLKTLQALAKAQSLYPSGHGAVQKAREALSSLLGAVFQEPLPLLLGLADGYLVLGDCAFVEDNPQAKEFALRLGARKLEGVLLEPEVSAAELGRFLEWLRSTPDAPWESPHISLTTLDQSHEKWNQAKRLHGAAVHALREADRDLREGRIPDPAKARECVAAFAGLLDETPTVLPGLLLIKDYDNYTFFHSVNVSLLSLGIGRQLGLKGDELECLGVGGLFHDIGKTRTPVDVIRKPGRLSDDEFAIIQWHPVHGKDILSKMGGLPEPSVRIAFEHHLGFDRTGYPEERTNRSVHPLTHLVTTADVYDAMTTHRPYQGPVPLPDAVARMMELRGTHLDPAVFDAFLALLGSMPVGSLVRLKTGEVAVVTQLGAEGSVCEVLVVSSPDGIDLPHAARTRRRATPQDVGGWSGVRSRHVDLFDAVTPQGKN